MEPTRDEFPYVFKGGPTRGRRARPKGAGLPSAPKGARSADAAGRATRAARI